MAPSENLLSFTLYPCRVNGIFSRATPRFSSRAIMSDFFREFTLIVGKYGIASIFPPSCSYRVENHCLLLVALAIIIILNTMVFDHHRNSTRNSEVYERILFHRWPCGVSSTAIPCFLSSSA